MSSTSGNSPNWRCEFLRAAVRAGAEVLVADPGRAFVPLGSLTALARYEVPVLTVIEDAPVKTVTVYRLSQLTRSCARALISTAKGTQ